MYPDIQQRDLEETFIWIQMEIRTILLISFKDKGGRKTAAFIAINWCARRGERRDER